MNNNTLNNTRAAFSRVILKTLSAIILLASTTSVAAAQNQPTPSTDRDNPAQLASNIITGDGVDSKTEYFYSFTAGPPRGKPTLHPKTEKETAPLPLEHCPLSPHPPHTTHTPPKPPPCLPHHLT